VQDTGPVHVRVTSIATGASLNTRPDVPTRGRQNTATTAPHGTAITVPKHHSASSLCEISVRGWAAAWLGREALGRWSEVVQRFCVGFQRPVPCRRGSGRGRWRPRRALR